MNKNDVTSISLLDLLKNFMTDEELSKIDLMDLSPEFLLECFHETPGILHAEYLGENKFKINSSTAGEFEVTIAVKEESPSLEQ